METLPNLCFADFYRRIGNSNKKKIYMVKAARSRQICEVATRDSLDQQFLSHDLSEHVAVNMLDKDLRSRKRIEASTENRGRDRESRSQQERIQGQTKAVETREKLLRQRKSFKERSCRDTVLYDSTPKEDNSGRNR